ncbi:MAG: hypothetical protein P4L81_08610, partial [Candidatus Pacebacteria bacterium]|nr:hypothetical protein [Candidatus Paceibacterota bacterium]
KKRRREEEKKRRREEEKKRRREEEKKRRREDMISNTCYQDDKSGKGSRKKQESRHMRTRTSEAKDEQNGSENESRTMARNDRQDE